MTETLVQDKNFGFALDNIKELNGAEGIIHVKSDGDYTWLVFDKLFPDGTVQESYKIFIE